MAKSYYAILGISPGAKADKIKAAHRHPLKEFHHDHYSGGNDIFGQIQEAYSVLSNNQARRQYDQNLIFVKTRAPFRDKFSADPSPHVPEKQPTDYGYDFACQVVSNLYAIIRRDI